MIERLKLLFLGFALMMISLSIFTDVYIDGVLTPSWNTISIATLVSGILMIKNKGKK
jgi:hypothetical protein